MNLCIHEFAHSLVLEDRVSIINLFLNESTLDEFKIMAEKLIPRIKKGHSKVIRKYGGTNWMELFAVSLETFFENPIEMHRHEPDLFKILKKLFKQDPRLIH
jgi:Mlc titration factor MtfA (ptsG expression regulator)